jgi:hypothetical protein
MYKNHRSFYSILLLVSCFLLAPAFLLSQTTYSKNTSKEQKTTSQSPNNHSVKFRSNSFKPAWHLTISGGPSLFFGDTRQYRYYPVMNYESEWKFGGSLMLARSITPVFRLRGQMLYTGLAGTRRPWKRYFNTELLEFNMNLAINLNNLINGYRSDRAWGVDLLVGVGLTNFNTTVYELGSNKIISKQGFGNGSGIGGRTLEGLLMGGIGFSYHLNANWALRFETANRALNSDKLDNHVGGFKYDIYNHSSLGLTYTFSSSGKNIRLAPEEPDLHIAEPDMMMPVQPDKQSDQEVTSFNKVIDVLELNEQPIEEPSEKTVKSEVKTETKKPAPVRTIYGIEYRVQIRARYGTKIGIDYLARTYNLPAGEIKEDIFNGYYIYTIGSFATYDDAASKRNTIRSQHGIYDAFVVAFKDGNRLQKLP